MYEMHDFDPTKREHINLSPLRQFDGDVTYSRNYYDLRDAFTVYLSGEFPELTDSIGAYCESEEVRVCLPDAKLFETDERLAKEQMRLALIRVALPLAEAAVENTEDFMGWVYETASMAMKQNIRRHSFDECLTMTHGSTQHRCATSPNCPLKVVKSQLLIDVMQVDFSSLDYQQPWAERKASRSLAKLEMAYELGLMQEMEFRALRDSYRQRCVLRAIPLAENSDN